MTNATLNKKTVTEIRERLNAAVARELEALGLEGSFGNATFSDHSVSIKFEATMIGQRSRKEQDKYDALIDQICWDYAIERTQAEEFVADTHNLNGTRIQLTGYNYRSKKMPIEFRKIASGTHHKGVESYLSLALHNAGIKKPLPVGAIPAPSAAEREAQQ
jgi:hypothetical protein